MRRQLYIFAEVDYITADGDKQVSFLYGYTYDGKFTDRAAILKRIKEAVTPYVRERMHGQPRYTVTTNQNLWDGY